MRTITWSLKGILLSAGLFLCFTPGMARAEDQAVGIVRIADGKARSTPVVLTKNGGRTVQVGNPTVVSEGTITNGTVTNGGTVSVDECPPDAGGHLNAPSRFGYFHPTGGDGSGIPLCHHYGMDYAVNPEYFDRRDGRLYAAQGYGIPMAVPLAPNVGYTYNYGWGIPSSRLTPVSRFVPHPSYLRQQSNAISH